MTRILILAAQGYLAVGLLVGLLFLLFAVGKVVPGAKGSSPWFRLTVWPGTALLWPLVLWKWREAQR